MMIKTRLRFRMTIKTRLHMTIKTRFHMTIKTRLRIHMMIKTRTLILILLWTRIRIHMRILTRIHMMIMTRLRFRNTDINPAIQGVGVSVAGGSVKKPCHWTLPIQPCHWTLPIHGNIFKTESSLDRRLSTSSALIIQEVNVNLDKQLWWEKPWDRGMLFISQIILITFMSY